MNLVVANGAERHNEVIRNFERESTRLCECKMVRMRWRFPTDKTVKCCHVAKMVLVAQPSGNGNGECRFVDAGAARNARGGR